MNVSSTRESKNGALIKVCGCDFSVTFSEVVFVLMISLSIVFLAMTTVALRKEANILCHGETWDRNSPELRNIEKIIIGCESIELESRA
jgi:hypothetical protein